MASASYTLLAFLVLALASFQLSHGAVVKGKVTCLDCNLHYDLSGIKVMAKCAKVKKLATATTEANGAFEIQLPPEANPVNCLARLKGGTSQQMYVRKKEMVSKVVSGPVGSDFYTISGSLAFYTACHSCKVSKQIGSSKTVDLPLPREWGLAPSSYYVPFFPIIGIP